MSTATLEARDAREPGTMQCPSCGRTRRVNERCVCDSQRNNCPRCREAEMPDIRLEAQIQFTEEYLDHLKRIRDARRRELAATSAAHPSSFEEQTDPTDPVPGERFDITEQ